MPANEIGYIAAWMVALWGFGWTMLPPSRRIFGSFPDGGLAAGRLLGIVLVSLVAFWGASVRLLPLGFSPVLFILAAGYGVFRWRDLEVRIWAKQQRRALLVSDAVFLAAFLLFLWVRMRNPGAGDLEKPMDMALLAAAHRADWLPFENPWYAGQPFTNYYYFGPLMAALLSRALATPAWFAYNLAFAAFAAFFLSLLWSVGAAVSGSKKWGVAVLLLVGLGGHLEPLRQMWESRQFWPLDWWKTSRVIPATINEYPAFTMLIGDAHAHFYALSLSALFFGLCFNLFKVRTENARQTTLALCGVLLGAILMTNTWDVPLYVLLLGLCVWFAGGTSRQKSLLIPALCVALLCASPYFARFKSQVSGVVFEAWMPDRISFFLFWGAWWLLAILAFVLQSRGPEESEGSEENKFCMAMWGVGLLALAAPYLFYIQGYFGHGELRHQDTVFKFGLQAWLLLGTGIACSLGTTFYPWLRRSRGPLRFGAVYLTCLVVFLLALAPVTVGWTRTTRDAPRDFTGRIPLSLNAMSFLPPSEQDAVRWLSANTTRGITILEPSGNDYDAQAGRFSTFTGIPTYLGWPQHVWFWGADFQEVEMRKMKLLPIFTAPNEFQAKAALEEIKPTYIVLPGSLFFATGALSPELKKVIEQEGTVEWPKDQSKFPWIVRRGLITSIP